MTSRWRPKNRRQILQLDDEGSQSPSIQNNTLMINPPVAITAPTNKLHALLGHYNSDEEDSSKEEEDTEFNEFMNEIKSTEEVPAPPIPSVWQELWDPQSGQPYFWHTITNELTWDKPQDLLKPQPSSKPNIATTKVSTNVSIKEESKDAPPGTSSSLKQEPPTKTFVAVSTPLVEKFLDPIKTEIFKKDEGKVSFKIGASEKNVKPGQEFTQAKTNGRLSIDVDSIIAAIEMEVPPDHKTETFVPLFRRRPQQSNDSRPKLGNDFKKFFPLSHQSVLDLEVKPDSPLKIVNTFKGLGFQEKEDAPVSTPVQKVQFVAGEILKPLVVVPPVVPMTLAQKIARLEDQLSSQELPPIEISSEKLTAQLEIMKEAWNVKKLDADFLEEWLDRMEKKFQEETAKAESQPDQVIDMVLEDSEGERMATPPTEGGSIVVAKNDVEAECLDSALNSFYTDLASLDAADSPVDPVALPDAAPEIAVASSTVESGTLEEDVTNEPIKGIKRTRMSSDMTSLVAKWQKINQTNT